MFLHPPAAQASGVGEVNVRDLPAGVQASSIGAMEGTTSWKATKYGGPCPPSGTHRYFFKIYALDKQLDLGSETTKPALLAAMEGHVLDHGELMGTYERATQGG